MQNNSKSTFYILHSLIDWPCENSTKMALPVTLNLKAAIFVSILMTLKLHFTISFFRLNVMQ